MKDIISDRLRNLSNLNDRKLLRDVLLDVYDNLIQYNLDMYAQLESRIYRELENYGENLTVYSSISYLENVDPISDFLHPMVPDDVDIMLDMASLGNELNNHPEPIIASVFMKCSNREIARMLNKNQILMAQIKTSEGTHNVNAKAKPCTKYTAQIEKLYRAFQRNNLPWATINCPFAYKFIDIVLTAPFALAEGAVINEITVDLGEYDHYKQVNIIPMWNIKTIEVMENSFPMPAIDRINYEHSIPLDNKQNGYLVAMESPDFMYTIRRENEFVIVTTNDDQQPWQLLQLEHISNMKRPGIPFEMLTNNRDRGFVGRFHAVKSIVIRTEGEVARLLCSYEQSKTAVFQGMDILEKYEKPIETMDYNCFMDDNIRVDANKMVMLLKFKVHGGEKFLVYDKIAFLVSEVQLIFPEYHCIGEIIT